MVSKQCLLNSYIYPFNKYWMRAYKHFNFSTKWWKVLSCAQFHLASTRSWAQSKPRPQQAEGRCSGKGGRVAVGFNVTLTPGHRHPTSFFRATLSRETFLSSWGYCGLVDMGKSRGRQRQVNFFVVNRPWHWSMPLFTNTGSEVLMLHPTHTHRSVN